MIQNHRPALHALILRLTPSARVAVRATIGHQAHGAFLAAVREMDPALAEALHATGVRVRPFTVSPLFGVPPPREGLVTLMPSREYGLRLTLLDAALHERFMARFLRSDRRPVIRLGEAELLVREIRGTPGSHPWAGYSSWAELVQAAQPSSELTIEFASPTAFGFGQRAWGKKIVVLPQPELVFDSLARSWNALAPAPLAVDREALAAYLAEDVVVKRLEHLATQMQHFGRAPQVGFMGRVTYGLMGPGDSVRRQLDTLAALAFYAGVGMKTTMGMGQARRVDGA